MYYLSFLQDFIYLIKKRGREREGGGTEEEGEAGQKNLKQTAQNAKPNVGLNMT